MTREEAGKELAEEGFENDWADCEWEMAITERIARREAEAQLAEANNRIQGLMHAVADANLENGSLTDKLREAGELCDQLRKENSKVWGWYNTSEQEIASRDAKLAATARAEAFKRAMAIYREIHSGDCRILSVGDACDCFLCEIDRAMKEGL